MPSTSPVLSPTLRVTFLGTGTSTGVPFIGCHCPVCHSPDPRNKRLRPSILVEVMDGPTVGSRLLVDTTPDMRTQMLRAGVERIDAVLMTHPHADHIFGMDDIRQFTFRREAPMPVYGTQPTLDHLYRVFEYCFVVSQEGGGKPRIDLLPVTPYQPFDLCGVTVTPLTVYHGELAVTAYKFGERFVYATDVSHIPDETRPYLTGLDRLILGTVRYDPHPTHLGLYQALDEIAALQPRQAYLTHLSHLFDHEKLSGELPANVAPGYDGLRFTIPSVGPSADFR